MPDHLRMLLASAKRLRRAQQNYMKDRGNDELGKKVAVAALELDAAIDTVERELAARECGDD